VDGTTWQAPDGAQAIDVVGTSTYIAIAPTVDQGAPLQRALRGAAPVAARGGAPSR